MAEAQEVLGAHPRLCRLLATLMDVGLGYLRLGQSASTLSGGEAQRVKLARELARRETGRTLYILDEPTTGLHFDDVRKLLHVLGRLVDAGNTVVVVEHNLDVIKSRRPRHRPGPRGGRRRAGSVVAAGTPEQVAALAQGPHGAATCARRCGRRRVSAQRCSRPAPAPGAPSSPSWSARRYLVSHSLGAMPRAAARAAAGRTRAPGRSAACAPGPRAGGACPCTAGDKVGRIIGAPAGSVVMHQNVSVCQSLVLSCFDLSGRAQQDRLRGAELPLRDVRLRGPPRAGRAHASTVQSDDGITVPLERFLAAIDETTLLVPLSHVIFKSGAVQDVAAITRRAHEVGALRGGRPLPVGGHACPST